MNEWSKKTLRLVKEQDYLDKLYEVYPHTKGVRNIQESVLDNIRVSFKKRNDISLLQQLLGLEKFPYKDSYVAFLRKDKDSINRNPKTVERICRTLYDMGIDEVICGVTEAKEANTRRGQQFITWARKNFKWVGADDFRRSNSGIVMLDANEQAARDFCNQVMDVGISKRPDIVAKSGKKYVIGEAKFLSATGGNQGRAFDDGMNLATNTRGAAYKIFVLDGVLWIEPGSSEFKRIEFGNSAVFTALLLDKFFKSIG